VVIGLVGRAGGASVDIHYPKVTQDCPDKQQMLPQEISLKLKLQLAVADNREDADVEFDVSVDVEEGSLIHILSPQSRPI